MKVELKTVPTFTMYQGDPWDEQMGSEYPIEVGYYHGSICLSQNGNEVLISNEYLKDLFREIGRHFEQAQTALNTKG